jgi:hypothetical protein
VRVCVRENWHGVSSAHLSWIKYTQNIQHVEFLFALLWKETLKHTDRSWFGGVWASLHSKERKRERDRETKNERESVSNSIPI